MCQSFIVIYILGAYESVWIWRLGIRGRENVITMAALRSAASKQNQIAL